MPGQQDHDERETLEARVAAGAWLRRLRKAQGFATGGEFARALRVDPSRLSSWERGRSAVPDGRAARIAEVLGMSELEVRRGLGLWVPDEASAAAEADADSESATNPFADPDERRVWDLARRHGFSEEERRAMVAGLRVSREMDRMDAQNPVEGEGPGK